jgi:hypothetical protein
VRPNFDLDRYAQVQEHGLVSGGYQGKGPNGLCVMQAYAYCTHRDIWFGVVHDSDFTGDLQSRIIQYNNTNYSFDDLAAQDRRDWLLSILPELYRFDELLAERLHPETPKEEPCLSIGEPLVK